MAVTIFALIGEMPCIKTVQIMIDVTNSCLLNLKIKTYMRINNSNIKLDIVSSLIEVEPSKSVKTGNLGV